MRGEYYSETQAVCRGCGKVLRGRPYHQGGDAYDPVTNERCPKNYFGGFVCSQECDFLSCLTLEQSMPGHGVEQKRVSQDSRRKIDGNWSKP